MASKENRELVEDAVDLDFPGQIPVARKQITDVATAYLALNPMMTAEQAVAQAAEDFEQSTVEINEGIRANVRGVPVHWEDADEYVRDTVLRQDFKDAGFPFEDPDDYTIIPNGDGTAAIAGPNGLIIFPNWDWQGATSEWFVNRAQIEAQQKQEEAVRIEKAQRVTGGLAGAAAMGGI